LKLQMMSERAGHGLQSANGLFGNFGANAVAGENANVQKHAGSV